MGYLIFALGVILGSIISNIIFFKKRTYGTLIVDESDSGAPEMYLSISKIAAERIHEFNNISLDIKFHSQK